MAEPAASPADPGALIRTKDYRVLLVLAAVIGVLVSSAAWGFLELIHYMQQWVYKDLPRGLGLHGVPSWWPLPVLGIAGVVVAFAIVRFPGHGGHQPSDGLKAGPPTTPIELPGLILAALASVGLGLVLGPEAPLIGHSTECVRGSSSTAMAHRHRHRPCFRSPRLMISLALAPVVMDLATELWTSAGPRDRPRAMAGAPRLGSQLA